MVLSLVPLGGTLLQACFNVGRNEVRSPFAQMLTKLREENVYAGKVEVAEVDVWVGDAL